MNTFITGGAGFIGRWLAAQCLQRHHRVTVYDNLITGRESNLEEFAGEVELIRGDILDEAALAAALLRARPQVVFHLAAHHFIPFCEAHPLETLRVNVEGTVAVLRQAAANGVKTVILASSGVVYPGVDGPLREDEVAPAVHDIYGLSKLLAEQAAEFFVSKGLLRCLALRLFNTYGPYETNPHLIPHIIRSARASGQIELGNLHTKRDYVYVEDVAGALLRCAELDGGFTKLNVGTGCEHSAQEVVDCIAKLLGTRLEVVSTAERQRAVDKPHQVADVSKLRSLTGWQAEYTLESGLRKCLAHPAF